ncbi:uncharacterized protein F54H12.2-like [Mauremys mutica]|uniref:uncharacterized protein F54H12.2-like n=1 Tax=Mauremys mutica TaxID=74926 RepID=UPI001D16007C|nr:uncharacterized protein F54H12.2-like [Mauremys mutica]
MEEAPVYQDMATEGPSEDSDVENQLIDPESWKDGDIVTGKATGAHDEVPAKPLQPDFENGSCVREYMQLGQATGKYVKDCLLLIDRGEFGQSYTLFAFDLTPDQECADHYSLIKTGYLRAEVRFATALPSTVNVIVYGVFDNVLKVNHRRNVLFDCM